METVDIGKPCEEISFETRDGSLPIQRILSLRGKDRMEAILSLKNAREVFRSLPEEEVYLTIKEIGEYDSLPLLSLMSSEQCQYLLDLELWKGFEFQSEKIEHWLPLLLSCEEEAFDQWLKDLDLDTLLLLLKKSIRIHFREREDFSTQEESPSFFTLDGSYYIEILKPSIQDSIQFLLRRLAAQDLSFYYRVLEQVQAEIEAELEERALHFREVRLEDRGFPPMEQALALYQYLNPNRLHRMLEYKEVPLPVLPEETPPPSFPMILQDQKGFFSLCLKEIEGGPLVDRLKMELAYMANQVMVADQPERIDLSVIQESLRKVVGYLSVGLEWLTGGEIQRAKAYIEQIPLKFIFQVGYGATLELKWRAEEIWKRGWYSEKKVPLSFLNSPWEERMEGLMEKRPLFYDREIGTFREFRSYEEIRVLQRDLDHIEILERILRTFSSFAYSGGLTWKTFLLHAFLQEKVPWGNENSVMSLEEILLSLRDFYPIKEELKDSIGLWLRNKVRLLSEEKDSIIQNLTENLLEG
ncbi:MAG: DUF6178 family protein [Thermodesulfobacteriota bacterium]